MNEIVECQLLVLRDDGQVFTGAIPVEALKQFMPSIVEQLKRVWENSEGTTVAYRGAALSE